jgi:hypothetical protein
VSLGKRWREDDLPALGWRHRRHYGMRATFITLLIDDGADEDIIERRVAHTRKSRSAFEGYDGGYTESGRAPRWPSSGSRAVCSVR